MVLYPNKLPESERVCFGICSQAEWEAHMAKFQKAAPGATSQEKWKLMTRIFKL